METNPSPLPSKPEGPGTNINAPAAAPDPASPETAKPITPGGSSPDTVPGDRLQPGTGMQPEPGLTPQQSVASTPEPAPAAGPPANPVPQPPAAGPQPPATEVAAPQKQRPRFAPGIVIVAAVAVLAGAGFGAIAYLNSRNNNPKPAMPTVKVGVLMAFTGGSSSMGYGEMKGIQLAQKQLGADNIELVQMDSQCDPNIAPAAMQRLVKQQVAAVIGDGCSSASVAALPEANANKIPMVSPSASSPTLSIPNDYFYRMVPPDTYQGAYLAKAVYKRGIHTVGIFYTNEPYGINMNTVFTREFQSLGGKVLTSVNAPSGNINLSSQIAAIKATQPQGVVFVSNSVVTGAAAIQLARQAGISVPFYGGDGLYDNTLIANAQSAAQGLTITTFPTGDKAFKQLLLTNDQGEQLYAAAQGYDAFDTVYQAVKTGARTGPQIKAALARVNFTGVSAHIQFDKNGDEIGSSYQYALLQVKDGSFVDAQ